MQKHHQARTIPARHVQHDCLRPTGNCPACTDGIQVGFKSTAKMLALGTGGFQTHDPDNLASTASPNRHEKKCHHFMPSKPSPPENKLRHAFDLRQPSAYVHTRVALRPLQNPRPFLHPSSCRRVKAAKPSDLNPQWPKSQTAL